MLESSFPVVNKQTFDLFSFKGVYSKLKRKSSTKLGRIDDYFV